MSNQNETGHAKNVANFSELCLCVNGFGSDYNPTRELIKPAALQTLLASAQKAMADYSEALSPYRMAVAERETAFEPVNKLVTRVMNALKATDTSSRVDETAQSLARKIKGERASAKTAAPAPSEENQETESKQISASQTSYDNRLDNLSKLVVHLQNIPQYVPNETELSVEALQTMLNNLKLKNNQAREATIVLDYARIARDKVLYLPVTGLTDIAFDTKVYVKSLFGATSPEFRQISGIEFKVR